MKILTKILIQKVNNTIPQKHSLTEQSIKHLLDDIEEALRTHEENCTVNLMLNRNKTQHKLRVEQITGESHPLTRCILN